MENRNEPVSDDDVMVQETAADAETSDDMEEPSISGRGCLGVIVAGIVVSVLLYVFVMSRNPDTQGPAYIAASGLFGFFVVGIVWGVWQQQRESDAARDAEAATSPEPGDDEGQRGQ